MPLVLRNAIPRKLLVQSLPRLLRHERLDVGTLRLLLILSNFVEVAFPRRNRTTVGRAKSVAERTCREAVDVLALALSPVSAAVARVAAGKSLVLVLIFLFILIIN